MMYRKANDSESINRNSRRSSSDKLDESQRVFSHFIKMLLSTHKDNQNKAYRRKEIAQYLEENWQLLSTQTHIMTRYLGDRFPRQSQQKLILSYIANNDIRYALAVIFARAGLEVSLRDFGTTRSTHSGLTQKEILFNKATATRKGRIDPLSFFKNDLLSNHHIKRKTKAKFIEKRWEYLQPKKQEFLGLIKVIYADKKDQILFLSYIRKNHIRHEVTTWFVGDSPEDIEKLYQTSTEKLQGNLRKKSNSRPTL